MKITEQLQLHSPAGDSAVTIGVFDGVHSGHRHLLSRLISEADRHRLTSIVITFADHPRGVLHPDVAPKLLTTIDERVALLRETGADLVIPVSFDKALSTLTAREFAVLLKEHVHMTGLVVGPDFAMGHRREGDGTTLAALGQEMGFFVEMIEPLRSVEGPVVRSTSIREAIAEGDMARAAVMLGREYSLAGTVVKGHGRGSGLGFATANLIVPKGAMVPRDGIYAAWAMVDGERYMAATSIGFNPTFEDSGHSIEAYLMEFEGDLYGSEVRLDFVRRLRDELKFDTVEGLQRQIDDDVAETRAALEAIRTGSSWVSS
jgi:riboflavin kinase/FMN adenylyltransferase